MRLLLDTHTFLWWASNPEQLSDIALALCRDSGNELYLSLASIWEMQIKHDLGKLELTSSLPELIKIQQQRNDVRILPMSSQHIFYLSQLPSIHKDPFDRMLIAQSKVETMLLVSRDAIFSSYDVSLVW